MRNESFRPRMFPIGAVTAIVLMVLVCMFLAGYPRAGAAAGPAEELKVAGGNAGEMAAVTLQAKTQGEQKGSVAQQGGNGATENRKGASKVWEDARVGVTLDKVERSDDCYGSHLGAMQKLRPPKKGYQYVCVYLTFKRITNVHVTRIGVFEKERTVLRDGDGHEYKLLTGAVRGVDFPFGLSGSAVVYVEGCSGPHLFQVRRGAKLAALRLVYAYKEGWDGSSKEQWEKIADKMGEITIAIPTNEETVPVEKQ
jgi:hypothetical protein